MKTLLPWLLAAGLLAGVFFQYQQNQSLRRDLAGLQTKATATEKLEQEVAALRPLQTLAVEVEQLRKDAADVYKLRNETTQLKNEKKTLGQKVAVLEQQVQLHQQQQSEGNTARAQQVENLAAQNQQLRDQLTGASAGAGAGTEAKNRCVANLKQIDGATEQWALETRRNSGDPVTLYDLIGANKYIREMPLCPLGGQYIVTKIGEIPRCSYPGHALPQ